MSPRRDQPDFILGGSITRAPNGYRATIQTTRPVLSPTDVQQLYANASQKRYTPKWDGIEPEGALVIYWTEAIPITCGRCGFNFGSYVGYRAGREYGIVQHTSRHYHPLENFPPDHFKNSPQDRLEPAPRRFWLWDEVGGRAGKASANFACLNCGIQYTRDLRRFGKQLFEGQPRRLALMP